MSYFGRWQWTGLIVMMVVGLAGGMPASSRSSVPAHLNLPALERLIHYTPEEWLLGTAPPPILTESHAQPATMLAWAAKWNYLAQLKEHLDKQPLPLLLTGPNSSPLVQLFSAAVPRKIDRLFVCWKGQPLLLLPLSHAPPVGLFTK